MDIRAGTGLDFHRLVSDTARPLMLGGTEIPGDLALLGHSDADLVLHALSDALLGALGLSDIGTYFPDTDPASRNLDSRIIMKRALAEMAARGFTLSNADITIIGEKPRIGPHRERIRESLVGILCITSDRISVKATTTEKMGFLGRAEGLGCMATVLIISS